MDQEQPQPAKPQDLVEQELKATLNSIIEHCQKLGYSFGMVLAAPSESGTVKCGGFVGDPGIIGPALTVVLENVKKATAESIKNKILPVTSEYRIPEIRN